MAQITAIHNTLLKKHPIQGSELAEDQKVSVSAAKDYAVESIGESEVGHTLVTLAYGAGTWYVYDDHWSGLKSHSEVTLPVPYFSQRDNYRDANRTCFSSSCAMLLENMKPGTLPGAKGDDKYIQTVFGYGDTTEADTHVKALYHYGLPSRFKTNGSLSWLKEQIDLGYPVPIGILHHGPANAPTGGGHWICVIGYDNTGFICHDPWGRLDHATGQYFSTDGEAVHYSTECLSKRWTVSNYNDGWCMEV